MYANRDIESDEALERYFYQHLDAMTKEDLRSKAAIAAELAYRDADSMDKFQHAKNHAIRLKLDQVEDLLREIRGIL